MGATQLNHNPLCKAFYCGKKNPQRPFESSGILLLGQLSPPFGQPAYSCLRRRLVGLKLCVESMTATQLNCNLLCKAFYCSKKNPQRLFESPGILLLGQLSPPFGQRAYSCLRRRLVGLNIVRAERIKTVRHFILHPSLAAQKQLAWVLPQIPEILL